MNPNLNKTQHQGSAKDSEPTPDLPTVLRNKVAEFQALQAAGKLTAPTKVAGNLAYFEHLDERRDKKKKG